MNQVKNVSSILFKLTKVPFAIRNIEKLIQRIKRKKRSLRKEKEEKNFQNKHIDFLWESNTIKLDFIEFIFNKYSFDKINLDK